MPNTIGQDGLQIQTVTEIIDEIKNGTSAYPGMLQIYGANINVGPNSPDGQLINLVAQSKRDLLEFLALVYASFDPDQASGRALDERCAINGVARNAGTYTYQNVTVTVTQALTLPGLDTAPDAPFTVADAAGNKFVLAETHVFSGAGSASLTFRAKNLGRVETTPNTITVISTVTLGVFSVNNPLAATSIGTNEETDYALRIRRAQSVSLPSQGYLQGLIGALLAVSGVTSCRVLENYTNTTDGNGIPGHSIWVIVDGGTDDAVANAIYLKRNAGCGMKGDVNVVVTQADGTTITISFTRAVTDRVWIKFGLTAITGTVDPVYVRNQILSRLSYVVGQAADASAIVSLVKEIAPNCYVTALQVSLDNVTYVDYLNVAYPYNVWELQSAKIIINGTPGT